MKLLFVDESSDNKFSQHLSVCLAIIDSAHYRTLKDGFHAILRKAGWNEDVEFKGAHIFSASKGDKSVSVEKRIEIVEDVIAQKQQKEAWD